VDDSTAVNVTALDAFGNTVNLTNNDLKFATSIASSLTNRTIALQNGFATHTFTSQLPGACAISLSRNTYTGVGNTMDQVTITIAVGNLVGFSFRTATPSTVVGTPLFMTVHAVDQYLNQVEDNSMVVISSSGSELDGLGQVTLNSGTAQVTLGSLLAQEVNVYATNGVLGEVDAFQIVFLAGMSYTACYLPTFAERPLQYRCGRRNPIWHTTHSNSRQRLCYSSSCFGPARKH
jgi:hypothetical protein